MTSDTHAGESASRPGEDEVVAAARARSAELDCAALGEHACAVLRFLACALRARAVVEIGTGAGVSGLHLLRGMRADGVLTSIDIEPECQRQARRSFAEAGFAPGRSRLITGQALDVLPRFTAGGYDLVFVDGSRAEYPRYYEQGVALLRPGGVLAFHCARPDGTDGHGRDGERGLRELARAVRHDERLVPASLPQDAGLLLAALADGS